MGPDGYSSNKDIPGKIRYQIEYYFSPENLGRPDKFVLQKMQHEEGRVTFPLKIIAGFQKVKKLSADLAVICEAMKDSELLGA
eukprot:gene14871-21969_t